MSDIGAPSQPQKASAISGRKTDPVERSNRPHRREDDGSTSRKDGDHQSEKKQTTTERGQLYRDPAVSIDAKTAHIRVGDQIKSRVSHRDSEGRPIIDTDKARFAVHPDTGLKRGDEIDLEIRQTSQHLTADLLSVNGQDLTPPKEVELIVIATHQGHSYGADKALPPGEGQARSDEKALKQNHPLPRANQPITSEATLETIASYFTKLPPQTAQSAINQAVLNTNNTEGPILSSSPVHAADKIDPLVLHTSSEDMKTLLNAQAKTAENTALANLSDLSRLPKIKTEISFQVLDLTQQARPVKFTLYPQNSQNVAVTDRIIAQTPLQEQTLLELGLPHQNKRHPIYDVTTQKGRFLAALPEALDLRGVGISTQALIPTQNALAGNQSQNAGLQAPILSAHLFSPDGARQAIYLTVPEKIQPLLDKTASAQAASASSPVASGTLTGAQGQQKQALITAVTQTQTVPTPAGQTTSYQLSTDQGQISFKVNWAGHDTPPLPFKIGDSIPIQRHDIQPTPQQTKTAFSTTTAVGGNLPTVPPLQSLSGWPALNFMTDTLPDGENTHSTSLSEDLAQLTARDGGNFTAALTHMMAASQQLLKGADPQTVIPKSLSQVLKNGQEEKGLLDQWVKDVMSATSRQSAEGATDWRGIIIPAEPKDPSLSLFAFMFRDLEQEQHANPDAQGDDDEEAAAKKEFIIEVEFSEFGPLQVGGRLYPNRLDITITTHHPLPEDLAEALTPLYLQALDQDKMTGHIHFNVAEKFTISAQDFLMS